MANPPDSITTSRAPTLAAARFIMVTCQIGAEAAVKHELARSWPAFRFAFSRPGFLTFKLPDPHYLPDDFTLGSVFARSHAFSLGSATGQTLAERASQTLETALPRPYDRLHVFPRDTAPPGYRDFEPGLTAESAAAYHAILDQLAQHAPDLAGRCRRTGAPTAGELILDVVLVEPNAWWIGFHRVTDRTSRYPGGLADLELPPHAVSRAYVKMQEALDWAALPLAAGDHCAEIGSAPGGAAQALLDRGLHVVGIDPAEMHPALLAHPRFTHIRKRGSDVRRREFRKTRWLFADLNVAPSYTLDTVESIVLHAEVSIRGLLLTLKLLDWKLAAEVPDYLERIASWGYTHLQARQLSHHRQEFCVVATNPPRH